MTISMEIRNNGTCTLRFNVPRSSQLSINKLKYNVYWGLCVEGKVPATCTIILSLVFFVSMVGKIKLCVLKSRSVMFHCTQ